MIRNRFSSIVITPQPIARPLVSSLPSYAIWLLLGLLSAVTVGGYLLGSWQLNRPGFPLDDAWIHQTYARNLANGNGWVYFPGEPSAGSTSPLWTALLAVGHLLGLAPYGWTYFLGWALLFAIACLGVVAFRCLCPERPGWGILAGGLLALEWHLAWAAGSGMETLLFSLIGLGVLVWLLMGVRNWFWLGILVGMAVWVRPDGIILLGPAVFLLVLQARPASVRLSDAARLAIGVAILFLPYLAFNRWLSGAWWPNTFYAKQLEYSALTQLPIWKRLLSQASLPLTGVGALLLPGFVLFGWQALRRKNLGFIALGLWVMGYVYLYAWRLPVTYQHGRYLIPAMPAFFLAGLAGLASWSSQPEGSLIRRVISKVWTLSAGVVLLLFWLLGLQAYSQDVAIIETEMVDTAVWVSENTPPEALIAAHDIGALGYCGERRLLDLAGLVSPEVIPFLRDEARLYDFLNAQRADYLVTFPSWYPQLSAGRIPVYTSQGQFSLQAGGENMAVYRWQAP